MVVVLGGGISGLSAAYFLCKKGLNPITLYEASNRVGGWISTEHHSEKKFLFETGPRTIRPVGPKGRLTLKLIEELGLSHQVIPITSSNPAAKNRMIFVNNKLCSLPSNVGGLFKTLSPFSKPLIMAALHDIKTKKSSKQLEDESMYDFFERRFGTEIAKYAISSVLCGICAGDAKEISVKFLMEDMFKKEQIYGGVIKGMIMSLFQNTGNKHDKIMHSCELSNRAKKEKWSIYSLNGGLEVLPNTMSKFLANHNVDIKTNSECQHITFNENHISYVINGSEHETNSLISSLPSYKLGSLIEKQHPELAANLKAIPYVDVAVVNLQFEGADLLKSPGFGFLIPPSENLPILGVIYDSCCFDMKENTVLTVMMGGKWFKEKLGAAPTHKELLNIAEKQISNILGINTKPATTKVAILRNCIPQYVVGHHSRVQKIKQYILKRKMPLSICGAPYDGVGVNDVINSAKHAIDNHGLY